MNKMLAIIFDNENTASEGLRALHELHRDGTITLYASGVVAKNDSGEVEVKQQDDKGPVGTAIGFAVGSLLGLLAGPVGLAVGVSVGSLSGMMYDLSEAGVDAEFVEDVSNAILPGKVALLAEVEEMWMAPVDTRMEALGGLVFRRLRSEVIDDQLAREAEAFDRELAQLKAELAEASEETKAAIQKQIDNTKKKIKAINKHAKEKYNNTVAEGKAKLEALEQQMAEAVLEQQVAGASNRRKEKMEKRKAELKAEFEARSDKLDKTCKLTKEALT